MLAKVGPCKEQDEINAGEPGINAVGDRNALIEILPNNVTAYIIQEERFQRERVKEGKRYPRDVVADNKPL